MRPNAFRSTLFCGLLASLISTGCLERKETISVRPNGMSRIEIEISGDTSDIDGPDALPTRELGWRIEREDQTTDDGKEKTTLVARRQLNADDEWPDSFAAPDDAQYDAALRFPTSLTIERRRDGTYYHFYREYEPREHARYQYYADRLKKFTDQLSANGRSFETMTSDERRNVVDLMAQNEAMKHVQYAQAGIDALAEQWPQDFGLELQQAVREHFARADLGALVDLLAEGESDERDAAIQRFADETIAAVPRVLEETLARLSVPRNEIAAFFTEYDAEQARHAATEDLADERWEIRLELPGELVAHTGDRVEDGQVVWEFEAEALFDRRTIVAATSVVRRGSAERD